MRAVAARDRDAWLDMRAALWPDGSRDEHAREIHAFSSGRAAEPLAVLIAEAADGRPAGFAELSIRPHAEGCRTQRVAYLEGWYVRPEHRRRGVGRALVAAAEEWGRSQGCTEFASDTAVENDASAAAHRACGFGETGVVRCFAKTL